MFIVGVVVHVSPHPTSQSWSLSRCSFLHKVFYFAYQLFHLIAYLHTSFEATLYGIEQPSEVIFSKQYFKNSQLVNDRLSRAVNIGPKVKFLFPERIFFECPIEVFSQLCTGNVQIEISILVQDSGEEVTEETKG